MSLYELPKFEMPKQLKPLKKRFSLSNFLKKRIVFVLILTVFLSSLFGFLGGIISGGLFYQKISEELQRIGINLPPKIIEKEKVTEKEYLPEFSQEKAIISAVKETSPSVVSIIITKELPIYEEYWTSPFEEFFGPGFQVPEYRQKGTKKQEIGGGSGFIVSEDGMILTNKHVVSDKDADYTVLTNEGEKFPAKVLALDPVQDLAIIKIENKKKFKPVALGDSSKLEIGQTVIAIGNALGEFRNTVSVGVISGLGRTITASGGGTVETLEDVIQTDAAINRGNSGGPLLNLKGKVIGINTAMSEAAENIGFAIPINKAKKDIEQIKKIGKIVYPFLGIRYVLITDAIKEENNLAVNYGAWVVRGSQPDEPAVTPDSAAEKAGVKENDIILEFNNEKITSENSLAKIIQKYNPEDKIELRVLRAGSIKTIQVTLGERSE